MRERFKCVTFRERDYMADEQIEWFLRIDRALSSWMKRYGLVSLRYSIAVIFVWFGLLKVLHVSPVSDLVTQTLYWVDPSWFVPFLGWWEVLIGLCFLYRPLVRLGIALLAPQMLGTLLPLVVLPQVVYQQNNPFYLTMAGQYVVKNLLIMSAAIMIGATVRQRKVVLVDV